MRGLLIFLAMFAAAFVAAGLAVSFVTALSYVRVQRGGRPLLPGEPEIETLPPLLKEQENLSTIRIWGKLLARVSHVHTLKKHIEEANLSWSPGRVTLAMLLAGATTGSLLAVPDWIPGWLAALAGLAATLGPYLYILRRRAERFQKFAALFPEALDTLTRALKAGYPLSAAIELLGNEQPEPLAGEMRRTRDEWKLGTSWDHALDNLASRIPIPEVRLFAAAVKMQNRIGGRLNDVLARVGEGMRDAAVLESEVRAISVHSRMTGMVLTFLPLGIVIMMMLVNPGYVMTLTYSSTGRTLILVAIIANVTAHFLIRHLSRVRM
ncbi:MAG: type II secretion system F family protein [Bryobacteraceae bacterium]|nr:type II secretion system F family protein [Bryobacteraceae bacterium]